MQKGQKKTNLTNFKMYLMRFLLFVFSVNSNIQVFVHFFKCCTPSYAINNKAKINRNICRSIKSYVINKSKTSYCSSLCYILVFTFCWRCEFSCLLCNNSMWLFSLSTFTISSASLRISSFCPLRCNALWELCFSVATASYENQIEKVQINVTETL